MMSKIKVMVVDDDRDWCISIRSFLDAHAEFDVCQFVLSGQEALSTLQDIVPDVILMDIVFDENTDGLRFTKEITKLYHGKIKIIIVTGFKDKYVLDAFSSGAVNYLFKEDFKELPVLIKKVHFEKTPLEVLALEYLKKVT